ncbi:MAG: DUF2304 domain-containing protein [Bowdeniella nasicola]|nr:DUF2304 domain-containing protein [Bowdeniella nasicola]
MTVFFPVPLSTAPPVTTEFSGRLVGVDRTWIQLLLIVGVIIAGVMLTRSTAGARHQAIRRLLMAAFAAAAVYVILFPRTATDIAHWLGVGRGADLLLYGLVIAFFGYVATSFKRFAALEHRITELSRQLAIARAARPSDVYPSEPGLSHEQPTTRVPPSEPVEGEKG